MTIEYKVETISVETTHEQGKATTCAEKIETTLNKLSKENWELVSSIRTQSEIILIFRRYDFMFKEPTIYVGHNYIPVGDKSFDDVDEYEEK